MRSVISILTAVVAASIAGASPPPAPRAAPPQAPEVLLAPDPASLRCESVVEMETAQTVGVTSAWLANGVRVHHLRMVRSPRQAVVTIALAGSKLWEDAATRGVSEIAAGVLDDWDAAAPQAAKAEQMEGRDLRIDAIAGQDALTIRLSGAAPDLEHGLRVVAAMLTSPAITPRSVEQAREQVVRELRLRTADPRAVLSDAINQAVLPATDPRLSPPDERTLHAIDENRVRDWIARHTRAGGAPIEAAFVGDIGLADALRLADATLGRLPPRPRIGPQTDSAARRTALPGGPVVRDVPASAGVGVGRSTVACGCFGPEMADLPDQRALRIAVRIATARTRQLLASPQPIPEDAVAGGVFVSAFTGMGMVLVTATIPSARAADTAQGIHEQLGALAREGPTPAELDTARAEMVKAVETVEADPRYWSGTLARSTALGIDPDRIAAGAAFYKSLTVSTVRDTLARYLRPDRAITLTIHGPAGDAK